MPCSNCGKKVTDSRSGNNVWYCVCGYCNHCHVGGIRSSHWYLRKNGSNTLADAHKYINGQSHGGHGWIPDANRQHPHKK